MAATTMEKLMGVVIRCQAEEIRWLSEQNEHLLGGKEHDRDFYARAVEGSRLNAYNNLSKIILNASYSDA